MKRLLVALLASCVAFCADMPPTPLAKPQLVGIVGTPVFDQNGELESFHMTANFRVVSFKPDGRTLNYQIVPVSFDLTQQGWQSLVIGTSIVEYQDIGNDLIGVATYVWKLYYPDALPTRRKVLREPLTAK